MADFDISWSFAAFKKVGQDFPAIQKRIVEELEEVAIHANGWFFHAMEVKGGWLRCDATPEGNRWVVHVREAQYVSLPPRPDVSNPLKYPEVIEKPDNNQFATVEAIQAELKRQKNCHF